MDNLQDLRSFLLGLHRTNPIIFTMTRIINVLILLCLYYSCAEDLEINNQTSLLPCDYIVYDFPDLLADSLQFGTDTTLDILTWNLENFPKNNQLTIDTLVELINKIDADIIAIQEISNSSYFEQLLGDLEYWDGQNTGGSYGLAFIYKSSLTVKSISKISELGNLTRTPYLLKLDWQGGIIHIINNHYKCCGNGTIEDDPSDEEYRRLQAVKETKEYLDTYLEGEMVILLGDLNDILTDSINNNVFWDWISDDSNYRFTDLSIACNSNSNWSYPSWPSHIDHVLVTNELFNFVSHTQTIKAEQFFSNNWNDYDKFISDHRPVGVRLKFK